ncbi:MAG: phage portal protein, partial [bacterium]|nr:phage portal protein [bacterium]
GEYHSKLIEAYEEALALGDCYLLINGDLTVTILPPQVVMPILAKDDYSKIIGYRITEIHQNPYTFSRMTITNDYTATERVRTVSVDVEVVENNQYRVRRDTLKTQTFKNVIGKIPIIHITNDAGSDERYGHPVAEGLLHAMYRYDEVFEYAISGNKRQGRPTPVIEEMGDVDQIENFWAHFAKTETYIDDNGETQTQRVMDFDADQMLTLGGGAKFKWASPASFTTDTQNLLELLFYLILQHSEIPEFVWGNAIASSKASAESQMPPFTRFIEKKQGQVTRWLNQVLDVALSLIRTYETSIPQAETASIAWMPLTNADGALTVQAVQLALEKGLIDGETALRLLPLDIEDPNAVIEKAKAEQAEANEEFDRRQEALVAGQRRDQDQEDSQDNPDNGGEDMQDDESN